jgi:hypothetical protein
VRLCCIELPRELVWRVNLEKLIANQYGSIIRVLQPIAKSKQLLTLGESILKAALTSFERAMDPPPRLIADHALQQPTPPQNHDGGMHENVMIVPKRESDSVASPTTPGAKKKRKRPSMDGITPNSFPEIDSILSQKRKPREKTACLPCRKRKVGCDRTQPCKTCLERRHPEVCIYENTDASSIYGAASGLGSNSDNVSVPRGYLDQLMHRVESLENSVRELSSDIRHVLGSNHSAQFPKSPVIEASSREQFSESEEQYQTREGVHTNNPITGQIVHIGGNSVPALLMSLAKHQESGPVDQEGIDWKELVNGAILPLLGLDNESATYPFVDLWSTPEGVLAKVRRLAEVLPSEQDCKTYFSAYVVIAQAVFPGVADMKEFEEDLMRFHLRRAQEPLDNAITEQTIYGKPLTWVALLFAVLASGCHFSDHLDRASRELTSKVFVCCSFECLRLANFLSNPNLEAIQAMVVFLNTLLNLYQAGVVWGMLGKFICFYFYAIGLISNRSNHTPRTIAGSTPTLPSKYANRTTQQTSQNMVVNHLARQPRVHHIRQIWHCNGSRRTNAPPTRIRRPAWTMAL